MGRQLALGHNIVTSGDSRCHHLWQTNKNNVFLYFVQEGEVPLASETPVELTQQLTSEADSSTGQTEQKVSGGENWFQDVQWYRYSFCEIVQILGEVFISLPESVTVSWAMNVVYKWRLFGEVHANTVSARETGCLFQTLKICKLLTLWVSEKTGQIQELGRYKH